MISPIIFELFAILLCAAWLVGLFVSIMQVFDIKMNIVTVFILLLGLTVACYAVVELMTWFVYGTNNFTLLSLFNRFA